MGMPAFSEVKVTFKTVDAAKNFADTLQTIKLNVDDTNTLHTKHKLACGDYCVYIVELFEDTVEFSAESQRAQNLDWQLNEILKLSARFDACAFHANTYVMADGFFQEEEDLDELRKDLLNNKL